LKLGLLDPPQIFIDYKNGQEEALMEK